MISKKWIDSNNNDECPQDREIFDGSTFERRGNTLKVLDDFYLLYREQQESKKAR